MAKLHVVDEEHGQSTPFLRGILTRSLQEAGLSFEDAYALASDVRDGLADEAQISGAALRERVREILRKRHGAESEQRYQATVHAPDPIWVQRGADHTDPFSRGQLRRHLESSGLGGDEATSITGKVFNDLLADGINALTSEALGRRVHTQVLRDHGEAAAQRYLIWTAFRRSNRPLLLLMGGVPGCGKSTIATEVAHRLEIVRTQPVDMLREVMRMMIPARLLPVLHESSYTAWQAMPGRVNADTAHLDLVEDGFRAQSQLLSVAAEAVIQRTLTERESLIIEGVHIVPGMHEAIPEQGDAVVVPVMLAVLKPQTLRQRIQGRGRQVAKRWAERYLAHFDDIWHLQSLLLSEADQADVAIIDNDELERTVQQVLRTIIEILAREGATTPDEVFGP